MIDKERLIEHIERIIDGYQEAVDEPDNCPIIVSETRAQRDCLFELLDEVKSGDFDIKEPKDDR